MSKPRAHSANKMRNRRAILDGARKAFLQEGYAASLDKIAEEAGVARQTIFNLFGTKDNLFELVLSEAIIGSIDVQILDSDDDIEVTLRKFAENYSRISLSEEAISLSRLVNAEYQRFPDLIGRLTSSFMSQMIPPLAAYFGRLVKEGRISSIDPDMAAEQFLALALGSERIRLSLGGTPSSSARRRKYLDQAVHSFVYGIKPPPASGLGETGKRNAARTTGKR